MDRITFLKNEKVRIAHEIAKESRSLLGSIDVNYKAEDNEDFQFHLGLLEKYLFIYDDLDNEIDNEFENGGGVAW